MKDTPDREELLVPANLVEGQSLAAFPEALRGVGGLDVLVLGAFDGGMAARMAIREGARATLADDDAKRLKAARAASGEFPPALAKATLAELRERFDPGSFDLAVSHLALARQDGFGAALAALFPLLRVDCLFAFTLPNPYLDCSLEEDPLAERTRTGGIEGWLPGPVHHRPAGAVSEALREAGFALASVRDFPGEPGRPETACLLFECGKEKW